jgi:hypothetical protein
MKKSFLIIAALLTLTAFSHAQYKFDPTFPNSSKEDSVLISRGLGLHGVAVGRDGNVWVVNYNTYLPGDSLTEKGTGVVKAVLPLRIFKPDGTPASFSPLMVMKGGTVNDTLWKGNTGRGLSTTPDGNILFTWFGTVYLLDYRTGAVITKIVTSAVNTGTAAAADLSGNIFTAHVAPYTEPLEMWSHAGIKLGNVADTTSFFSRTLTCSRAGDKVYFAAYTGDCVIRYTGDLLFGFSADTVLKGLACESIAHSGNTEKLWVSSGSGNDAPNGYPGLKTYYSPFTWYLWDPQTNALIDSIKWIGANTFTFTDSLSVRPRGVSTTVTGDTVYVCMFGSKMGMYSVQRFIKEPARQVIPTNEWVNFWSDSSYVDGRRLDTSDVIDAYDPQGTLCGRFAVKESGKYGMMPVYRDDASTATDEGAEPGDLITFQINGYPAYVSGAERPIWTANGDIKKINLVATTTRIVLLPLKKNWNLVSWNVDTPVDNAVSRFAPIADKLTVALGFDAGGLTYDPSISEGYNTLKTVDHLHGYWLKMKDAAAFSATGAIVNKRTPISLRTGYNLVSYLPETEDSLVHALASVIGNAAVVLGFDGGGLTFDPSIPAEFNTLKIMRPGYGYWIRMKSTGTLIYPSAGVTSSSAPGLGKIAGNTTAAAPSLATPTREWMSVWGNNLSLFGKLIPAGTVVTAKTAAGVLCGSATLWADGKFGLMPIYRDDASTKEIEGAEDHEAIVLTIGDYRVPKTILWTEHGAVVDLTDAITGIEEQSIMPTEYALAQNYPNPFNPTTTIQYQLPKAAMVTLKVYDVLGREVACLVNDQKEAGYYQAQWNATQHASGVYFYAISAGDYHKTMKLQLLK